MRYRIKRINTLIEPCDMLHIKNFSYDGVVGVSTLSHASQSIGIATQNEESVANFFESGGRVTGVLTEETASRLKEDQIREIYAKWKANTANGGIQVVPGNLKFQSVSVNPKDAQMLESRQFNVVDICRFYGVSPVKAFDLSHSSYATVEATQLQYLVDTVLPYITKFEQELNNKLLLPSERGQYVIEFDTSVLLRTDKSALAAYWNQLFQVGAATPNEVRQKNNLPRVEGGDEAFVQVNVQTLRNATRPQPDSVSDK
uniref:Putative phage portal protein n=1 Tax=uncultured bacterium fosmid pJB83B9 TaxID=1478070 RepID=A0A0H3U9X0_9BACT|nr:putative phage portal protein [uncultured bacterium fosmid pJB83B9]